MMIIQQCLQVLAQSRPLFLVGQGKLHEGPEIGLEVPNIIAPFFRLKRMP
jgi:hypothetical protein